MDDQVLVLQCSRHLQSLLWAILLVVYFETMLWHAPQGGMVGVLKVLSTQRRRCRHVTSVFTARRYNTLLFASQGYLTPSVRPSLRPHGKV